MIADLSDRYVTPGRFCPQLPTGSTRNNNILLTFFIEKGHYKDTGSIK